jgi:hypothetical protein
MLEPLVSRVTALEAQGIVNEFLSDRLPDRFTADQGILRGHIWVVPIILAYPEIGSIGTVGEVQVDGQSGTVVDYTAIETMKQTAMSLYQANQNAIQAAIPSTRNT